MKNFFVERWYILSNMILYSLKKCTKMCFQCKWPINKTNNLTWCINILIRGIYSKNNLCLYFIHCLALHISSPLFSNTTIKVMFSKPTVSREKCALYISLNMLKQKILDCFIWCWGYHSKLTPFSTFNSLFSQPVFFH